MRKRTSYLLIMLMLCIITLPTACNRRHENGETVFNKRFINKVETNMSYDELVKRIGKPGVEVKDGGKTSPGIIHYHWDGERNSALDAMVEAGKVVDATLLAPNGDTYRIGEE